VKKTYFRLTNSCILLKLREEIWLTAVGRCSIVCSTISFFYKRAFFSSHVTKMTVHYQTFKFSNKLAKLQEMGISNFKRMLSNGQSES